MEKFEKPWFRTSARRTIAAGFGCRKERRIQ